MKNAAQFHRETPTKVLFSTYGLGGRGLIIRKDKSGNFFEEDMYVGVVRNIERKDAEKRAWGMINSNQKELPTQMQINFELM